LDSGRRSRRDVEEEAALMSIDAVLAGIPVAEFDAAVGWYETLLGRPADDRPMEGLADWHFAGTGSVQVVQDAERAGKGLLTLSVDDLADFVSDLEERGLRPGPIDDTTSTKVLFLTIADPEGNAVTLVEPRA
jgi:catechol 2,3-dioxygenase-like lactoylglutathione lyase family enzyme